MYTTFQRLTSIVVLVCVSVIFLGIESYAAVLDIKLIVNPNKTDVYVDSEPVALTAQVIGRGLQYQWGLIGPGQLDGTNLPAVFYTPPKTITGTSAQAVVTLTVTDSSGQEATKSVTFNILPSVPTPTPTPTPTPIPPEGERGGMSTTTKIALGVGAAALIGGGIAVAVGLNDDDDDGGGDEGILSVHGDWTFSGQITTQTCDTGDPYTITETINILQTGVELYAIVVSGTYVDGSDIYFIYTGTLTGNSLRLVATDPYIYSSAGVVIHVGSGLEIRDIKDDKGSGSFNITSDCITGCTGSCQTVWGGDWTRISY